MAQTFRETDGDIRAVLTTMISAPEFFSEGAYRSKRKTPLEMVVSAVRATGAQVESAESLVKEIATPGGPLYCKIEPTGYSNRSTDWVSSASLLERLNFSMRLGQGLVDGVTVDSQKLSDNPAEFSRQLLLADLEKQTRTQLSRLCRTTQMKNKNRTVASSRGWF